MRGALRNEERKVATVLFADIADSTSLGERFDVEPLGEIIGAFHRAASDAVEGCDGTAEFVGDGVVAVFGIPLAIEHHQARALEAADLILDSVERLNRRLNSRYGITLGVRIGVNTGEVLVDPDAAIGLGRIAGDTFNVAARLQQEAAIGQVLATERTMASVRDRPADDLGRLTLAGRVGPVHTFRVGRRPAERPSTPYGPLIGRESDLEELAAELTAARDGRRRLVTIIGEAGIGKSHLLDAFAAACRGEQVVTVSCPPFGGGRGMEPLARLAAGTVPGGASPEAAVRRLLQGNGDDVEALVQTLGGEGLDRLSRGAPGRARRELSLGWRRFLSALCSDELYVLIVEDLHWAAPELIELLAAAVEPPTGHLLLACSARPEFLSMQPEWPRDGPDTRLVVLEPLDVAATGEIAVMMDPESARSENFGAALHRLTEGNPFFTVELMRALDERETLPIAGALGFDHVDVPDTVQGVIAGRIDRLTRTQRRVLHAAAVIGREFPPGPVGVLAGISDTELLHVLDDLAGRKMVERVEPDAERARWRFAHALTRDVAYGSIPHRSLPGLHEAAARSYLESSNGADWEIAPLMAHHLLEAHTHLVADWDVDEADAERIRSEAFGWSVMAARRALAETALSSAKQLASSALELATNDAEAGEACECLGRAHFFAYEGDDTWEMLTRAGDLARRAEDQRPEEIASLYIQALEAAVRWPGGMHHPPAPPALKERIDQAFELLGEEDSIERVRLLTVVGFWPYATDGRTGSELISGEKAVEAANGAADMARRLDETDLESAALDGLTSVWISAGDYASAEVVVNRRLELFDRLSDPWEQGDLCAMGGWVAYHRAAYDRGIEWAARGVAEFGDEYPSVGFYCMNWLGLNLFRAGRWTDALGLVDRLDAQHGQLVDPPPYLTPFIAAAALIRHLRGDDTEADRLLDILFTFERVHHPNGDGPAGSRWAEYLGPIIADRGGPETALDLIASSDHRRASRLSQLLWARCWVVGTHRRWGHVDDVLNECERQATERGTPIVRAAAATLRAGERWVAGEVEVAARWFDEGWRLAEEAGDHLVAGWAALGLARTSAALGHPDEAASQRTAAADRFRHLGATRALTEAQRTLAPT